MSEGKSLLTAGFDREQQESERKPVAIEYDDAIEGDQDIGYLCYTLYLAMLDHAKERKPLDVRSLGHATRMSDTEVGQYLAELQQHGYLPEVIA